MRAPKQSYGKNCYTVSIPYKTALAPSKNAFLTRNSCVTVWRLFRHQ